MKKSTARPTPYLPINKLIITSLVLIQFLSCNKDDSETMNETNQEEIATNYTEAEALLILVNKSRATEGLSSLTLNNELNNAALAHSTEMNTNNYFDHTGLNGSHFSDRTTIAGYTGSALSENIGKGQNSVENVHNSWMESDGHRANILNANNTEMGLGHNGIYWTEIFGRAK